MQGPVSALASSVARAAMEKGGCGRRSKPPSVVTIPSRKAMEEMWPSPTARSDMTKRMAPGRSPDWSGCRHTDGFISAAEV